jgi:hypothetical protein
LCFDLLGLSKQKVQLALAGRPGTVGVVGRPGANTAPSMNAALYASSCGAQP